MASRTDALATTGTYFPYFSALPPEREAE